MQNSPGKGDLGLDVSTPTLHEASTSERGGKWWSRRCTIRRRRKDVAVSLAKHGIMNQEGGPGEEEPQLEGSLGNGHEQHQSLIVAKISNSGMIRAQPVPSAQLQ